MNNINEIQILLTKKPIKWRLNLLPYDGTPEIKQIGGNKYLYIRKRVLIRLHQPMLMFIVMNFIISFKK